MPPREEAEHPRREHETHRDRIEHLEDANARHEMELKQLDALVARVHLEGQVVYKAVFGDPSKDGDVGIKGQVRDWRTLLKFAGFVMMPLMAILQAVLTAAVLAWMNLK